MDRLEEDRPLRPPPFAPVRVRVLLPADEVHLVAKNDSDGPVDVNLLYIGADWSIRHWF